MAESKTRASTAGRRDTGTVTTAAVAEPTDRPAVRSTEPVGQTAPVAPALPERSPDNGIALSVGTVQLAFRTGSASTSVAYVQHAIKARGFTPGNTDGVADHATREAFARFQESVAERGSGLPTHYTLDYLGFDVF